MVGPCWDPLLLHNLSQCCTLVSLPLRAASGGSNDASEGNWPEAANQEDPALHKDDTYSTMLLAFVISPGGILSLRLLKY